MMRVNGRKEEEIWMYCEDFFSKNKYMMIYIIVVYNLLFGCPFAIGLFVSNNIIL